MQIVKSYDKETGQWVALNVIESNSGSGSSDIDESQVNQLIDNKLSPINNSLFNINSDISSIKEKDNTQDSDIIILKNTTNNIQTVSIPNLEDRVKTLEDKSAPSTGLNETQVNNLIDNKLEPINTRISTVDANVGPLTNLQTESKSSIVDAVNELFTSASNGKELVANAITGKGVYTLKTDTFATMADNINKIETGGGESSPTSVNFDLSTSKNNYNFISRILPNIEFTLPSINNYDYAFAYSYVDDSLLSKLGEPSATTANYIFYKGFLNSDTGEVVVNFPKGVTKIDYSFNSCELGYNVTKLTINAENSISQNNIIGTLTSNLLSNNIKTLEMNFNGLNAKYISKYNMISLKELKIGFKSIEYDSGYNYFTNNSSGIFSTSYAQDSELTSFRFVDVRDDYSIYLPMSVKNTCNLYCYLPMSKDCCQDFLDNLPVIESGKVTLRLKQGYIHYAGIDTFDTTKAKANGWTITFD